MAGDIDEEVDMQAVFQRLEDVQPQNIDINSHFTADELNDMPEIEKNRYRSIKLNYLVMMEFGIPANMPEFMRKKRRSKCPPPTIQSDSDSDEDWRPKKAKQKGSNWRPPPVKFPRIQKPVVRPKKPAVEKKSTRNVAKRAAKKTSSEKPENKGDKENSDDEEFTGFTEVELVDFESFIDCRIRSITEAISRLDTDDSLTLTALEALEPTVLRATAAATTTTTAEKPTETPPTEENPARDNSEEKSTKDQSGTQSGETPKSPESAILPLFGCSLSQSSNPDIADLLNDEALDIAEVDPKSWDNLLEGLDTMSPGLSRVGSPVNCAGNIGDGLISEELVKECYSHLQSQPAAKILDLPHSQSDSGLGDTSLVSGSDAENPGLSENERKDTDKSGESQDELESGLARNRYPKRSMERVNYKDVEVPEDDEFIWCEDCDQEYKGDCPVCGPLIIVEDTPASQGDPNYAAKTIPDRLYIDQSAIPGAGTGVYAKSKMQKGVRFGPYQGECVLNEEEAHESGYSWEIQRSGKTSHFVDARAASASNWMRYVNCARNSNEQNLLAFQYCGRIYYRTLREIYPREELLVWYGDAYGEELGLTTVTEDLVNYWNQELQGFHCPQPGCTMMYTDSDRLIVHLLLRHKIILKQTWYHCLYCRHSCNTETRLREHMRNCSKRPAQYGSTNSSNYYNKELLTESLNKYKVTDDKHYMYKCEFCGKGFESKGNLQMHRVIHTGERAFRCDICHKAFTVKCNLDRHMRYHTGEKPFKCKTCGKRFTRVDDLRRHVRIHTGEKPYKCDECGEGFTQKGHLTVHIRTHTGDRPYKCNICGLSFTHSTSLDGHKRKNH